jgi:hypothetical protein
MGKYLSIVLLALCSVSTQAEILTGSHIMVKMERPLDSLPESSQSDILYPSVNTQRIIEVFKAAVDRGELQLFEQTVEFSALRPQQVELTYKVGEEKPTIKVYSMLNKAIPLPAMPDMRVEAVTVTLDGKGRIIEAVVHVHH